MEVFGCIRETQKVPSLSFSEVLRPSLSLFSNSDVDLSRYATDSSQRRIPSCTGNATADAIEILMAIEEEKLAISENREPEPVPQCSRLFVYNLARAMMDQDGDNFGDIDKNDGTYIRLCFEVLSRYGICQESLWPYDENNVYTLPSMKAMREAIGHKIHSYYAIKETGDDKVEQVITALRSYHPVVFGTNIDEAFTKNSGPEVIDRPVGETIGAHAMIIVGYKGGLFKVKNSWGPNWRKNGYCFMTPSYIAWDQTWDLWVPTMGTSFG